jgi:hypothetical protein
VGGFGVLAADRRVGDGLLDGLVLGLVPAGAGPEDRTARRERVEVAPATAGSAV